MKREWFQKIKTLGRLLALRPEQERIAETVIPWEGKPLPKGACVLIGAPDDRGVAIARGRVGAKEGPNAVRKELYKMSVGATKTSTRHHLYDLGDLKIGKTQKEFYDRLAQVTQFVLESGPFPIVIGGGHDVSYGSLSAFLSTYPQGRVINIDPHFDFRPPEDDGRSSNGTPFRRLLDEGKMRGTQLTEFGYQSPANSPEHFRKLTALGAHLVRWETVVEQGVSESLAQVISEIGEKPLALSFDVDSIDVSAAPGVSAINPDGLSNREARRIIKVAKECPQLKYLDFMELNPKVDPDNRTARLVALLIHDFLN